MSAASVIARATVIEALREKILYVFSFFAVVTFIAARAGAPLFLGETRRIICDAALLALSLHGLLVIVFVGLPSAHRDIGGGRAGLILSRPVGRGAFVAGKALGLALTLAISEAVLGSILGLVLAGASHAHGPAGASLAGAVALTLFELMILAAIGIFFAAASTPIPAALFVTGAWMIGRAAGILDANPILKPVLWIVPRFDLFDAGPWLIHGVAPSPERWAFLIGYGILYASAFILFARIAFGRRAVNG